MFHAPNENLRGPHGYIDIVTAQSGTKSNHHVILHIIPKRKPEEFEYNYEEHRGMRDKKEYFISKW